MAGGGDARVVWMHGGRARLVWDALSVACSLEAVGQGPLAARRLSRIAPLRLQLLIPPRAPRSSQRPPAHVK